LKTGIEIGLIIISMLVGLWGADQKMRGDNNLAYILGLTALLLCDIVWILRLT
jgi:hypothetical protein